MVKTVRNGQNIQNPNTQTESIEKKSLKRLAKIAR